MNRVQGLYLGEILKMSFIYSLMPGCDSAWKAHYCGKNLRAKSPLFSGFCIIVHTKSFIIVCWQI